MKKYKCNKCNSLFESDKIKKEDIICQFCNNNQFILNPQKDIVFVTECPCCKTIINKVIRTNVEIQEVHKR